MSGDLEAAADAVTGGLVARSVEPRAGDPHGEPAHGACLNCGTTLIGTHCHCCGQAAHVHRTISAIGHEIAHGVFHFEGKIWRTLPMLVTRPGELTRRYVEGERARFVSPMAFFLFTVFLMFTVVANLPGWSFGDSEFLKPGVAAGMAEARTKLAEEKARAAAALGEAQRGLAKAQADSEPDAERIARLTKRVATTTRARDDLAQAERVLPAASDFKITSKSRYVSKTWLDRKWRDATENPKLVIYKIKTSAYKYSWALIPISLPFLWLLFPLRRDVGLYDHAVFATYSLTFMSLLTIILALLGAIGIPAWLLWTAAVFVPPFHMYRQLKGAYRLGRWSALWRTFLLLNFTLFTTTIFVLLLLYLGVD